MTSLMIPDRIEMFDPPFEKGGLGGILNRERTQIPLCPPFSKGDAAMTQDII